jgi:hypothetical protein
MRLCSRIGYSQAARIRAIAGGRTAQRDHLGDLKNTRTKDWIVLRAQ